MARSYYPIDDDSDEERVRFSVRLSARQNEDLESIAKLWNEIDLVLERKRPRKWKSASVIERMVQVGIDGFWEQIGGRPPSKEGRQDFIRKAIADLRKPKK